MAFEVGAVALKATGKSYHIYAFSCIYIYIYK